MSQYYLDLTLVPVTLNAVQVSLIQQPNRRMLTPRWLSQAYVYFASQTNFQEIFFKLWTSNKSYFADKLTRLDIGMAV